MGDANTLVKTHPRDKLLLMRLDRVSMEKAERIKEKERKRQLRLEWKAAKKIHDKRQKSASRLRRITSTEKILEKFAEHYLGARYLYFSIRERLELIKLCTSYCRRWFTIFASPLVTTLAAIFYSGIFISAADFLLLLIWMLLGGIYTGTILKIQEGKNIVDFFEYIEFLFGRQLLVESETNKLLGENNYKT